MKKKKIDEVKAKITTKATSKAKTTADPAASSSAAADLSASSCGPADPKDDLAADGWDVAHPIAGKRAYFISEKITNMAYKEVEIVAVRGGFAVVEPYHVPHKVTVPVEDLDVLPRFAKPPVVSRGVMSGTDKKEGKIRFGDDLQLLTMDGKLTDRHMMVGHWQIQRDVPSARGVHMMSPQIVFMLHQAASEYHEDAAAMELKAAEMISRRFQRSGLLGVPICAADHWTLLCFRRSSEGEVKIKYYDSLKTPQSDCLKIAHNIVKMLMPEADLKDRSNRSVQTNGVDCGVYCLHYWDQEIRLREGFGWLAGWPQANKEIRDRKKRLVVMIEHLHKWVEPVPKKKSKAVVVEMEPLFEDDKARFVTKADVKLADMAALAKFHADLGSVTFYGCSKCRYIRTGCINWKCNPDKGKIHKAKFPDKYPKGSKDLEASVAGKIDIIELIGGGAAFYGIPNHVAACLQDCPGT